MKYTVYKIIARSDHSYVGMTKNLEDRVKWHEKRLQKGLLGSYDVPRSFDPVVMVPHETDDVDVARLLELREIRRDLLKYPHLNCNRMIRGDSYQWSKGKRK